MQISINQAQINKVGNALKQVQLNHGFQNREFLNFSADRETKLRVYFLSAAICHQTRTLHHPDLNLFGWEFMEYGFLQMLKKNLPILNPGYLSICSSNDTADMLKKTFSPDGNPNNCTLDRIEERVNMLLDICAIVKKEYKSSIANLIDASEGYLIRNGKGLYEQLPRFLGFSDPQKKKITFFLKLAIDAGVIKIKDPENLIPIMDYHMQRVLLRSGCVQIDDPEIQRKLSSKTPLSSDEPIRGFCIEALRQLAKQSGIELLTMNDIFWPLGRSCCFETTLCTSGKCEKNPCTLTQTLALANHDHCILQNACMGSSDVQYRSLFEPYVETHYY